MVVVFVILQRIDIQQYQVRQLARGYGAERVNRAQRFRRVEDGTPQDRQRNERRIAPNQKTFE